ncbi:MAG: nucleotidyltransferase family protein, partial [Anaerolineales bacterium]
MTANALNQTSADAKALNYMRLCLQGRRNPAALAAAETLAGDLDWETVGRLSSVERVGPLLHQAAGGRAAIPTRLQAQWRKSYLDTARRNLAGLHELSLVLRRLQARQVEVLVLKGAGLIPSVYGN